MAGRNCHLLIHECTFEDIFQEEAINKKHSTISEALSISEKMNAQATVFTHFSLRYKNLTRVDEIIDNKVKKNHSRHIGVAFDFMKCEPEDFQQLDNILHDTKVVFKQEIDTVEQRRDKKIKRS